MGLLLNFGEKRRQVHISEPLRSFESIMNFTKTISSLVSLIASITFNNLFGVEN